MLISFVLLIWIISCIAYEIEEVDIDSSSCPAVLKPLDHALIEFKVESGGRVLDEITAPGQLFHLILEERDEDIYKIMKGMCLNSTRIIKWESGVDVNINPVFSERIDDIEADLRLTIKLIHITEFEEYQIFNAMRADNFSMVIDLIDSQKGINAIDEFGQTVLMQAVQRNAFPIVASLLNARRPRVLVNTAKSNGRTALFYALEIRDASILKALLRRGANPNVALVKDDDGGGQTPLHLSCLLEMRKHTELLLEYGADPFIQNMYGQYPLQLLPRDATKSTKMFFKKAFENAINKMSALPEGSEEL